MCLGVARGGTEAPSDADPLAMRQSPAKVTAGAVRVRAGIFGRWRRIELDTMRSAVPVDPQGFPFDWGRAWGNVCDALDVFVALGLPDDWRLVVDGEEVPR